MARHWEHIRVQAGALRITGSIQKICNADTENATIITDWTTGTFKSLNDSSGATVDINAAPNITTVSGSARTENIVIQHGECLDGPFIAVHLNDDNSTAIYHNGIVNVVDAD